MYTGPLPRRRRRRRGTSRFDTIHFYLGGSKMTVYSYYTVGTRMYVERTDLKLETGVSEISVSVGCVLLVAS
jgi:hypothetical protein